MIISELQKYLSQPLAQHLGGIITGNLSFNQILGVYLVPQYPHAGLFETSRIELLPGNFQGKHQIDKTKYSHQLDRGEILDDDGARLSEQIHLLVPLFTSYIEWQTQEDLDGLNVKGYRSHPSLYSLGSVHLESAFPGIKPNSPILSKVELNRNNQLAEVKIPPAENFRDYLTQRVLTSSDTIDGLNAHRYLDSGSDLASYLWSGTEALHYFAKASGTVITYGWPALITIWGGIAPPPTTPTLPGGGIG